MTRERRQKRPDVPVRLRGERGKRGPEGMSRADGGRILRTIGTTRTRLCIPFLAAVEPLNYLESTSMIPVRRASQQRRRRTDHEAVSIHLRGHLR